MPVRILRPGLPPLQEPIVATDATGMIYHLCDLFVLFVDDSCLFNKKGEPRTLGSTLNALLPAAFPSPTQAPNNYTVLVQGITPPLNSSIAWLVEHFSHPDNFLYITIIAA